MGSEHDREFAPAKVNLTLHVTGRRNDGYHLLDSLVAFVDVGDVVSFQPCADLRLAVTGPFANSLTADPDNLVLRAARLLAQGRGATLVLEKHLPIASGIGGGSSDAAATIRLLARTWQCALPPAAAILTLGADVPACLTGRSVRMRGVGEQLLQVSLPVADIVLVNPGVSVATPLVFRALANAVNAPMPEVLPELTDVKALCDFLITMRNDLENAASSLCPEIVSARTRLAGQDGCLLARMSGSGATCFGVFRDQAAARQAEMAIRKEQPTWWVAAGRIADQEIRATTNSARS